MHGTIDLETLGTCPNSIVLSIGAVKFDPRSKEEPNSELYLKVSYDDQVRLNRTISDNTLDWWSKQDSKVIDEAFDQSNAVSVIDALKAISKWCVGLDAIWGQGYGFDLTILEDMFRSTNMPIPWHFWQVRDSRTLFTLFEFYKANPRTVFGVQHEAHNALSDAYYQSKGIQAAYQELDLKM